MTYQFVVSNMSPVSQLEGTIGNHGVCMRRKMRDVSGEIVQIPVVTADAMRHGLREVGAELCLDAAGLLAQENGPQLTEAALRLLYSGGMLTGRGDSSVIKLDRWREITDTLPILALMGGCVDAMMIPGKLLVQDMWLVCEESHFKFPSWVQDQPLNAKPSPDYIEHCQRVRFDVTRNPHKQHLLSEGARTGIAQRMLGKEAAHEAGEVGEKDRGRPMPHSFESVAAGSLWYWEISARQHLNELEQTTLLMTLAMFFERWHVGGKTGTGHGKLRVLSSKHVELPSFVRTTSDVSLAVGPVPTFKAAMQQRSAKLVELLKKVDA